LHLVQIDGPEDALDAVGLMRQVILVAGEDVEPGRGRLYAYVSPADRGAIEALGTVGTVMKDEAEREAQLTELSRASKTASPRSCEVAVAYPPVAYPSTVTKINDRMTALANNNDFKPLCARFDLSSPTHEGRTVRYLRVGTGTGGGSAPNPHRVGRPRAGIRPSRRCRGPKL
jgi:hypothetical protein